MRDETLVKIVAIVSLAAVLIVDFYTMKIDSTLVGSIAAIIGGIAGYQIGIVKAKKEKRRK